MRTLALVAVATTLMTLPPAPSAAAAARPAASEVARFEDAVARILDLPYDPSYAPTGTDAAFGDDDWPAAFPVTDTTTGTCCTGPVADQPPLADLAPPFAAFPDGFELVELASFDGTPLHAYAAITPGAPGVVVMHGFNTNGKHSIVRYAAFLAANGFSVVAPDHRDMGREWERGGSWWPGGERHGQSIGWKEAEDLLVAAGELRRRGASGVGVLGFSEGAQNTILALGRDLDGWIDAALTFSGPSDQRTQVNRESAATAALLTTVVNQPDVCTYLGEVGRRPEFTATPNFMLRQASAVDTLDGALGAGVEVPALHFYAEDDELVPGYHATILASRTRSMPLQHTVLVEAGNHAYFYDRWWTQAATLEWFRTWLDPDGATTTATPTVARPPAGTPLRDQTIDLSGATTAAAAAERDSSDVCPTVEEPVGPTALLRVDGEGAERRLDGRRSWSGWDDHDVVGWRLDPGDGSDPVSGTDLAAAVVDHAYLPGTWEATLSVTDDTGRTATASSTIEVAGDTSGAKDVTRHAAEEEPPLPATGGGMALAAAAVLIAALRRPWRPPGRERGGAVSPPAA